MLKRSKIILMTTRLRKLDRTYRSNRFNREPDSGLVRVNIKIQKNKKNPLDSKEQRKNRSDRMMNLHKTKKK